MTRVANRLSLAERLRIITEAAPGLRRAGLESFTSDECSFTLAKLEPEAPRDMPRQDDNNSDPLFDPASYPGGKVPGYNLTDNLDGNDEDVSS